MKQNPALQRSISNLSSESIELSRLAFDISDRIVWILKRKGITIDDLCLGLGRSQDEVAGGLEAPIISHLRPLQLYNRF